MKLAIILCALVILAILPTVEAIPNGIVDYLYDIRAEEIKQTKLLDQTNCYSLYTFYTSKISHCGEPLNMTGVWKYK